MKIKLTSLHFASFLILMGALSRLIPHPANFTAITALSLFSGYALKNTKMSIFVLFGALLFSDMLLGFHTFIPIVYLALLIPIFFGRMLSQSRHKVSIGIAGGLFSTILFFVFTNFAVWASGQLYPRSFEGFLMCYTAAIPFFKNQISGDLFYSTLLFGVFALTKLKCFSSKSKRICHDI